MTPFGIRSGNDIGPLDGEYIVDSMRLANEQAPEGVRFYFDEADMADCVIDGQHCVDMFGWLVPESRASEFEPLWKARLDDELDAGRYTIVSFDEVNGKPVATFG